MVFVSEPREADKLVSKLNIFNNFSVSSPKIKFRILGFENNTNHRSTS